MVVICVEIYCMKKTMKTDPNQGKTILKCAEKKELDQ